MNQPVSKWVNTEPDPGLPHALLERLVNTVPVAAIQDLWLFPTRRIAAGESTVFVVAAIAEDPERRRVITARYLVTRDRKGSGTVQEKLEEHGTAPASAVTRVVNGVLHRMGEEGEQPPRAESIEGDQERWWALIEELGGRRPEAAAQPPAASLTHPPVEAAALPHRGAAPQPVAETLEQDDTAGKVGEGNAGVEDPSPADGDGEVW